jgi:DNA-binding transcriptional MerR regulator
MKIAELAKRAGVATSAVCFYEGVGALPAGRRLANGYREYTDADLARLRLVVALRRLVWHRPMREGLPPRAWNTVRLIGI